MSQVEGAARVAGETHVWQAPRGLRIGVFGVCAALVLLSAGVLSLYGYLAVIGVSLVLALVVRTWWMVLRPKLTAGPGGVRVVWTGTPVDLPWSEIRRCDPTVEGLKIVCTGGREVLAKYPQQPARPVAGITTEAGAAAAYLAQRAAWARKPSGPAPVYVAPPPRPVGP